MANSKKHEIRSRFSAQKRVQPVIGEKSLTQQNMKEETDINTIVQRYIKTGLAPTRRGEALFGDFSEANDFMQMKNAIMDIEQNFLGLSARLRKKFANDPYQLMRWLENPDNAKEAIKLGLLEDPEGTDPFIDENQTDILGDDQEGNKGGKPSSPPKPKPPEQDPARGT